MKPAKTHPVLSTRPTSSLTRQRTYEIQYVCLDAHTDPGKRNPLVKGRSSVRTLGSQSIDEKPAICATEPNHRIWPWQEHAALKNGSGEVRLSTWAVSETTQEMIDALVYVVVMALPISHTGARTIYLRVYPLRDDTSGEAPVTTHLRRSSDVSSLTKCLRELRALHHEDYMTDDEYDERRDFFLDPSLALTFDSVPIKQLRSDVIRTPKRKTGLRWLKRLLAAVVTVIIVGLVISGVVYWYNV